MLADSLIRQVRLYSRRFCFLLILFMLFWLAAFSGWQNKAQEILQTNQQLYGLWQEAIVGANKDTLKQAEENPLIKQSALLRLSETFQISSATFYMAQSNEDFYTLADIRFAQGKAPENSQEIAVEKSVLDALQLDYQIGQRITLTTSDNQQKTYRICGIIENYSSKYNPYLRAPSIFGLESKTSRNVLYLQYKIPLFLFHSLHQPYKNAVANTSYFTGSLFHSNTIGWACLLGILSLAMLFGLHFFLSAVLTHFQKEILICLDLGAYKSQLFSFFIRQISPAFLLAVLGVLICSLFFSSPTLAGAACVWILVVYGTCLIHGISSFYRPIKSKEKRRPKKKTAHVYKQLPLFFRIVFQSWKCSFQENIVRFILAAFLFVLAGWSAVQVYDYYNLFVFSKSLPSVSVTSFFESADWKQDHRIDVLPVAKSKELASLYQYESYYQMDEVPVLWEQIDQSPLMQEKETSAFLSTDETSTRLLTRVVLVDNSPVLDSILEMYHFSSAQKKAFWQGKSALLYCPDFSICQENGASVLSLASEDEEILSETSLSQGDLIQIFTDEKEEASFPVALMIDQSVSNFSLKYGISGLLREVFMQPYTILLSSNALPQIQGINHLECWCDFQNEQAFNADMQSIWAPYTMLYHFNQTSRLAIENSQAKIKLCLWICIFALLLFAELYLLSKWLQKQKAALNHVKTGLIQAGAQRKDLLNLFILWHGLSLLSFLALVLLFIQAKRFL